MPCWRVVVPIVVFLVALIVVSHVVIAGVAELQQLEMFIINGGVFKARFAF